MRASPIGTAAAMQRKPGWKILEFICEDNNRCVMGNCTAADVQQTTAR
jgi:hypothetical protein